MAATVAIASGTPSLCRSNEGISSSKALFGPSARRLPIIPAKKSSGFMLKPIISPRASLTATVEDGSYRETGDVPTPKVIIDLDSDPDATVVEITFGDRLGALLDTMNALKNLGLNVVKANVFLDSSGKHNTFAVTKADTGRKVEEPEMLEQIRLTIISNLLQYHPESSDQLAMGAAFGIAPPREQEQTSRTEIGLGEHRQGVYYFQNKKTESVARIDVAKESRLWHQRLGHPSKSILPRFNNLI